MEKMLKQGDHQGLLFVLTLTKIQYMCIKETLKLATCKKNTVVQENKAL
jgi:hypothetical protein